MTNDMINYQVTEEIDERAQNELGQNFKRFYDERLKYLNSDEWVLKMKQLHRTPVELKQTDQRYKKGSLVAQAVRRKKEVRPLLVLGKELARTC